MPTNEKPHGKITTKLLCTLFGIVKPEAIVFSSTGSRAQNVLYWDKNY